MWIALHWAVTAIYFLMTRNFRFAPVIRGGFGAQIMQYTAPAISLYSSGPCLPSNDEAAIRREIEALLRLNAAAYQAVTPHCWDDWGRLEACSEIACQFPFRFIHTDVNR